MLIETLNEQELALRYAHYVYRNTALEDYHAQNIRMDDVFYKSIHCLVACKLSSIPRYAERLQNASSPDELNAVCFTLTPMEGKRFLEFLGYFCDPFFAKWDTPIAYANEPIRNKATYLLSGRFAFHCNEKSFLDDAVMCDINKDVYNRIYTLVLQKLL